MPDVSMVRQALNHSTPSDRPHNTVFLPPLDGVGMTTASQTTLHGSRTPHSSIQTTLSRSQSQVVQFLNSSGAGSVFDCLAAPSHNPAPVPDLYPFKGNSLKQPIKTPVMHPNLVCTLKSILSPKLEFDTEAFTSSGDSRCTPSGCSPILDMAEVQSFDDRINSLAVDHPSSKAGSPESTSRSNKQVPKKSKLVRQEAVLVPVDLIQNRRPYQCAFAGCQRTFKNPQTMRMHHKTHFSDAAAATTLGAEALRGPLSGASQALKAGHNKKIPSQCPTCYKTFVGLYELRRHFGRKHSEGEKQHACRKCGKQFHIEVDVRDHEKLCGEPILCTCGMKFAFKCNLVAHKRNHPKCQNNALTKSLPDNNNPEQSKKRRLSETLVQSHPLQVGAQTMPAMQASSQFSPVQPFSILDSASTSSSPFSSTTSSPSASFIAEAFPDFDVTSSSSLDLIYQYSSLSSRFFQADSYIKFPSDHYFLAYQAAPPKLEKPSN